MARKHLVDGVQVEQVEHIRLLDRARQRRLRRALGVIDEGERHRRQRDAAVACAIGLADRDRTVDHDARTRLASRARWQRHVDASCGRRRSQLPQRRGVTVAEQRAVAAGEGRGEPAALAR